ncbi:SRPBCC family protein [Rhodococcus marinonascens]|uniref:SRPBCC family protein n=1 Tax=Rhodococcus marinonascens TaxID=38311 RepID=UPI0014763988|nr:SRPBCC family protein [Rhodococcus marinonascens]
MKLSNKEEIIAPAEAVWDVIGRRFDKIGEWATAVPASAAISGSLTVDEAPVAGRICQTGIRVAPSVTEAIVAYDDSTRSLTYEAVEKPGFLSVARNRWTVTPVDQRRSTVSYDAVLTTRGVFGRLAGWWMLILLRHAGRQLLADLAHYVEHGVPSPRKQAQLDRATRRGRRPTVRAGLTTTGRTDH